MREKFLWQRSLKLRDQQMIHGHSNNVYFYFCQDLAHFLALAIALSILCNKVCIWSL